MSSDAMRCRDDAGVRGGEYNRWASRRAVDVIGSLELEMIYDGAEAANSPGSMASERTILRFETVHFVPGAAAATSRVIFISAVYRNSAKRTMRSASVTVTRSHQDD